MCATGVLEGMCFELQPGNFLKKHFSFFDFFYVCICVDENPVLCDMTPSQCLIGCRTFEEQWKFPSLKVRPLFYIVYVMPLMSWLQNYGLLKNYIDMLISDSVLKRHTINYVFERRLPGVMALKIKLVLSCETSVPIYYSPAVGLPIRLEYSTALTWESHISLAHHWELQHDGDSPHFCLSSKTYLMPKLRLGRYRCGSTSLKSTGILFRFAAVFG